MMPMDIMFNGLRVPTDGTKIKVVSHTDVDGYAPVILLKLAFPNAILDCEHIAPDSVHKVLEALIPDAEQYDTIIVTDLGIKQETADLIENTEVLKSRMLLIDHHSTAKFVSAYSWGVCSNQMPGDSARTEFYRNADGVLDGYIPATSATGLLYDFLDYHILMNLEHKDMILEFAHQVSAYDTWEWKTRFGADMCMKNLSRLLYIYGPKRFCEKVLQRLQKGYHAYEFSQDRVFIDIEDEHTEEFLKGIEKRIYPMVLDLPDKKLNAVVTFTDRYLPDVFNLMLDKNPDVDVAIIYTGTKVSMRTRRDDIDLGVLAGTLGGGGHAQAAGFSIPQDLLLKHAQEVFGITSVAPKGRICTGPAFPTGVVLTCVEDVTLKAFQLIIGDEELSEQLAVRLNGGEKIDLSQYQEVPK